MHISMNFDKNSEDVVDTCVEITAKREPKTKRRIIIKVISVAAVLFGFVIVYLGYAADTLTLTLLGALFLFFGCLYLYMSTEDYMKKAIKQEMKKLNPILFSGGREYTVDDGGVNIKTTAGESMMTWDLFKGWSVMNHYLYVESLDGNVVLFDEEQLNKSQKKEIEDILKRNLGEMMQ